MRDCDDLARLGGEEFVVLRPRTELHGACNLAERVRADIAKKLPLSVSVGLTASIHGDDAVSLVSRADRALYAAKAAGRNRVFLHDSHNDQLVGIRATAQAAEPCLESNDAEYATEATPAEGSYSPALAEGTAPQIEMPASVS